MDITQTKRVDCELVHTMFNRKGTLACHPVIILSASIHCTGLELKSMHSQMRHLGRSQYYPVTFLPDQDYRRCLAKWQGLCPPCPQHLVKKAVSFGALYIYIVWIASGWWTEKSQSQGNLLLLSSCSQGRQQSSISINQWGNLIGFDISP